MKNLSKLFLGLLLAGVVLTGCQEASELVDVTFPANYETELDVVVTPSTSAKSTNGVFSVNVTIDPTSDSDFAKYLDNIKEVNIEEVTDFIESVSLDITLTSVVISVSNDTYDATWEFVNLPITAGATHVLSNDNGQWDTIEKILLDKKPFNVSINGEANEDNAEFKLLLKILSNIIATPL